MTSPRINQAAEPPRIPDHELLRRIGRGSYGDVWLARNVMGVHRAVKVVYRDRFESERPFEREFEGIRRFEPVSRSHESQVDILHVGRQEGCFYYVMELADDAGDPDPAASEGRVNAEGYVSKTLREVLKRQGRLPFGICLDIALDLTTALAHLHAHGLVHRDVKPSNIIFVNDIPKLADIGLVTETDSTLTFVGTEGFYPPEGPGSPQADLYSLGKVLYEMTTGRDRMDYPELPTRLREESEAEGFVELNEVILKACEADVARRYQEAEQMHQDLLVIRAGKSLRRARRLDRYLALATRMGVAAALLAALFLAGFLYQRQQAHQMQQLAAQEAFQRERAEAGELALRRSLYASDMRLVRHALREGDLGRARGFLERHIPARGETDLRGWEWHHFHRQIRPGPHQVLGRHQGGATSLAISDNGHWLVSCGPGGEARLWNLSTGKKAAVARWETSLAGALFSPTQELVLVLGGYSSPVVCRLPDLREVATLSHAGAFAGAFEDNGRYLWTANAWKLKQWDISGWNVIAEHDLPEARDILLCPTRGLLLMALLEEDRTRIIRQEWPDGDREVLITVDGIVSTLAVSEEGHTLAAGLTDGTLLVWKRGQAEQVRQLRNQNLAVHQVVFSPDSRHLVSAGASQQVAWWDLKLNKATAYFRSHSNDVWAAAMSSDGGKLYTAGQDEWIRVWDVPPEQDPAMVHRQVDYRMRECLSPAYDHSMTPDESGQHMIVRKLTSLTAEEEMIPLPEGMRSPVTFGLGPNGTFAVLGWPRRGLGIYELPSLDMRWHQALPDYSIRWPRVSMDGRWLSMIRSGRLEVWRVEDGGAYFLSDQAYPGLRWARFIGRGIHALVYDQKRLVLHDVPNRSRLKEWIPHEPGMRRSTLSPDGQWLVTGGNDGSIKVWNMDGLDILREFKGLVSAVTALAVSNDSSRLATGHRDGRVVLWDVAGGLEVATLQAVSGQYVDHLAFLNEDDMLMAFQNSQVTLWLAE